MKEKYKALSLVGSLLALSSNIACADSGVTLKTGIDYTSGKYGTSTRSDITSIPFSAAYETGPFTYKVTVPYIRSTGASDVIAGVGKVNNTTSTERTTSGLGDITTALTYAIFTQPAQTFGLDVTGKVKFSTADSAKGLGTGKNDYTVLLDAYQNVKNITYFGGVGYAFLGKSDTLPLKNVVSTNLGVSYKINALANAGLSFDARQKTTNTNHGQRELTAYYSYKLGGGYKTQLYAVKGFSDGSPDFGVGMTVGYSF